VRITADINVLVRAAVIDDPIQGAIAAEALLNAEVVAVTLPSLCEFVWVLSRGYKKRADEVASALRTLIESASVLVDRLAVEAGLAALERGGDFADGVIAFEGRRAGGPVFVSFDRDAVALVEAAGFEAKLLGKD
jgi:predicted nucleic-acid-binding protein